MSVFIIWTQDAKSHFRSGQTGLHLKGNEAISTNSTRWQCSSVALVLGLGAWLPSVFCLPVDLCHCRHPACSGDSIQGLGH